MPLSQIEVRRLEEHLSQCEQCRGLEKDFRGLARLLRRLSAASEPDRETVTRLRAQLATITRGERP